MSSEVFRNRNDVYFLNSQFSSPNLKVCSGTLSIIPVSRSVKVRFKDRRRIWKFSRVQRYKMMIARTFSIITRLPMGIRMPSVSKGSERVETFAVKFCIVIPWVDIEMIKRFTSTTICMYDNLPRRISVVIRSLILLGNTEEALEKY